MDKQDSIKLFEEKQIRTAWDEEAEKWYFSIVDVVSVLTDQPNYDGARNYWKVLKNRLNKEGSELVTTCNQLKMVSPKDGKAYKTDVADTEQLLRLIQSIPSKKAEPFKLWLARVGRERIDEIADPELAIDRAVEFYRRKGYSEKWINQRIKSIEVRKDLTDEWDRSEVTESRDYAILTNEITQAWSGKTVSEYKRHKGLKKENLRDNMIHVVAAVIRDGDKIFATQRGYGAYKDFWEFPGGKIEAGETPQQALVREIEEELDTEIVVGDLLTTIEYDYPEFHLSMQCFWCEVAEGKLTLKEHEAARWLDPDSLDSVGWLPADLAILPLIKDKLEEQAVEAT